MPISVDISASQYINVFDMMLKPLFFGQFIDQFDRIWDNILTYSFNLSAVLHNCTLPTYIHAMELHCSVSGGQKNSLLKIHSQIYAKSYTGLLLHLFAAHWLNWEVWCKKNCAKSHTHILQDDWFSYSKTTKQMEKGKKKVSCMGGPQNKQDSEADPIPRAMPEHYTD